MRLEHLNDTGDWLVIFNDADVDSVEFHEVGTNVENFIIVAAGA
jgi:hypothetical protein